MRIRPVALISHCAEVGGSPNCKFSITTWISLVARFLVRPPPIAISEVEAKNAVPFCSAAMIWASTMRSSRWSARRIQMSR
jgi:hypothetical protein